MLVFLYKKIDNARDRDAHIHSSTASLAPRLSHCIACACSLHRPCILLLYPAVSSTRRHPSPPRHSPPPLLRRIRRPRALPPMLKRLRVRWHGWRRRRCCGSDSAARRRMGLDVTAVHGSARRRRALGYIKSPQIQDLLLNDQTNSLV